MRMVAGLFTPVSDSTNGRSWDGTVPCGPPAALADPAAEQGKYVWDLAVFGHPGNLSFTKITKSWLAQAAKRWAAEQLPRHRGSGAARVQTKLNNLGLLSQHLHRRPDHGLDP